ncbi:hypothetical protein GRI97_17570 [Altererythrobacter xixiisoli]|uniref:Uncharacterized protein n=1 Tax=Croceibacterium xixiisoli TaxID=1476466 RepID=A0A6I4U0F0_9SPHN|nr:hypothetical protein [Croceibacterium xixiisoli]MXP00802.1 hypothetical protein [Croceibacterium xixiisoli]
MRSSPPIHPLWCRCGCARPHRRRRHWRGSPRSARALLGLLLLAGMLAGLTLIHFAPAVAAALN